MSKVSGDVISRADAIALAKSWEDAKHSNPARWIANALAHLPAVQPVSEGEGWLPIESAPRTGERILVAHGNSVWEDEWWNGNDPSWLECHPTGHHKGEVPTHWQPLPEPPALEAIEVKGESE